MTKPVDCTCTGTRTDIAFHHPTCKWRVEMLRRRREERR